MRHHYALSAFIIVVRVRGGASDLEGIVQSCTCMEHQILKCTPRLAEPSVGIKDKRHDERDCARGQGKMTTFLTVIYP